MLNIVLSTEVLKLLVVELPTVVSDNDSWDAKSEDYMASDEAFHLTFRNKGQWFGLNPFCEVVYGY